jgi:hypothetical protein
MDEICRRETNDCRKDPEANEKDKAREAIRDQES